MAAPLVDGFMMWRCKCGKTSFRHHEHCDSCGEAQPAPPPEAEPSDVSRPDPGPVTGGMDMGLDVARRTDYASHPGREDSWWSNPGGDGSSYLSIHPVDDMLHVGDVVTVGYQRWVIVDETAGVCYQEAPMQRADEPAVLATIKCPHCGDVTEQSFMLSEFTCGSCDEPFQA